MLKKYCINYSLRFRNHSPSEILQYFTDDPIAAEEFLQNLLEHGMAIHAIKHKGADLPRVDFDRMVKVAAAGIASRLICTSLNIKSEEERYRFGFAA